MRPLLLALVLAVSLPASAQSFGATPPRIGAGFEVQSALYGQDVLPNGPSLGVRVRAALPVNADVSVAASLGLGAHLFEGADDSAYVLNPQTSVIVTLPGGGRGVRYVLGGLGGFLPFSGGGGGASIHAGVGTAIPLLESSFYFEVDPSLVIGADASVPVLALRAGVIF